MPPADRFAVKFYRDDDGQKPVTAFLREIDRSNPELAARIKASLRQLEDPHYHGHGHTKDLGDDLYELRILGRTGVRIIFFFAGRRLIVVLHAFLKKSQRLPPAERATDLARKRRHTERGAEG